MAVLVGLNAQRRLQGQHLRALGIEGEDSLGVVSAVELLRHIGDNEMPDFTGQNVAVIGGGNVAMDVTSMPRDRMEAISPSSFSRGKR